LPLIKQKNSLSAFPFLQLAHKQIQIN